MKGNGPSIKGEGNGIKLSCRTCDKKLKESLHMNTSIKDITLILRKLG